MCCEINYLLLLLIAVLLSLYIINKQLMHWSYYWKHTIYFLILREKL